MFSFISKFLARETPNRSIPSLSICEVRSYDDYKEYIEKNQENGLAKRSFERNLIQSASSEFTLRSYCYVCRKAGDFLVDFSYAYEVDGVLTPNWRERLVCPECGLNNRMRATVHIFDQELRPKADSKIYLTEQTTALYRWFERSFSYVFGSEYLGKSVHYGALNSAGIRNEDLTRLSFDNEAFDYILSFDVFEHIPGYKKAILECYRCLKAKGVLYFSVPFVATSENNIVRAMYSEAGEVLHLLPPEYHGNPLNPEGCLCFYHFGWEILQELKVTGFEDVKAFIYWSRELGYLGGDQLIFAAVKGSRHFAVAV